MAEIAKKAKKNPLQLSKEDLVCLHSTWHAKEDAERIAEAYIAMKNECPEIFEESVKVDIALATNSKMPPKKWATSPYFPKR